jgi:aminopeptidase N
MQVASLTQVEAEERAALLEVERYDIEVDLTALPGGPGVRCVSTVTFTCRGTDAETFVDCAADVLAATLDGEPLPAPEQGRIRLAGLGGRHTLRVETEQAETSSGPGVHRAVDPADGEVYLWTSFEPDEARFVWACFDQPDLKAVHAFTVTAPAAWTVTSNTCDASVEDLGGTRRWTFPPTPPLSTYNTVVNAGPFHELRREAGRHDLRLYTRRSLAHVLDRDADEIFRVTAQGLEFFGEVFGMPFPQRRYDQVFVPEFGGAMENYGCVTWSDALLRRSEPTGAERELFAKILLHEMAHMWFGNIVTMRWWDDLWLNEAFAELACNWAATRATAYTQAWAGHLAGEKLEAYLADQGPTSHPIRQPIADVAQAASIFDAITYPKGASVLRQLMVHLGEPVFEAGMTAYFGRYAWGNATLEDLVGTLAATAGRDLTAWRAGWLETAGTDRLTLERDGDGLVLVARGPQGGPPRPHTLAVGAYRSEGSGLRREALVEVAVDGPRTPVPLPADAEILLVNDEDLTFAAVRPEPASRDRLLAQAGRLPSAISRGVAVATAWDMLVAGDAGPEEMVRSLLGVLRAETAETVLEPYLRLAGQVAELWAPSGTRQALQAEIAQTCRELAADPGRRRVALRALARTAADADELARLAAGGDADVDLRWRTLIRRAELGAAVDAEVEALRAEDPDPDAGTRELAVRAAVADGAAKEAVWTRLTEDPTVPLGAFREVASAFWRPDQERLLAPYAERYAALLPGFDRGGMIRAMVLASALFPVVGAGAPEVERVVEAGAGTSPVVSQTVRERADEVRRMLRARAGTR